MKLRGWPVFYFVVIILVGFPIWREMTRLERVLLSQATLLQADTLISTQDHPLVTLLRDNTMVGVEGEKQWLEERVITYQYGQCKDKFQALLDKQAYDQLDGLASECILSEGLPVSSLWLIRVGKSNEVGPKLVMGRGVYGYIVEGKGGDIVEMIETQLLTKRDHNLSPEAIDASPMIRISFSLMNEDRLGRSLRWDFTQEWLQLLQPFLSGLQAMVSVKVDSQVRHCVEMLEDPIQVNQSYVVKRERLPYFFHPDDWAHSGAVAEEAVLNVVLLVPGIDHTPLYIDEVGKTSSYLIPRRASIVLYNRATGQEKLDVADAKKVIPAWITHVRRLLGIGRTGNDQLVILKGGSILPWEARLWSQEQRRALAAGCIDYAKSLDKLMRSQTHMPLPGVIAKEVDSALHELVEGWNRISSDHKEATQLVSSAYMRVKKAFFDQRMYNLAHAAPEHEIAHYIPHFFAMAVPIVRIIWIYIVDGITGLLWR